MPRFNNPETVKMGIYGFLVITTVLFALFNQPVSPAFMEA